MRDCFCQWEREIGTLLVEQLPEVRAEEYFLHNSCKPLLCSEGKTK